jgi:hypothetical protein
VLGYLPQESRQTSQGTKDGNAESNQVESRDFGHVHDRTGNY